MEKEFEYRLTVIVVNYNVEYFLEQCLNSVRKASKAITTEVIVVDNNSIDGSVAMVQEKFPEFGLISNKDNPGFSKANNQAIRISKGEYVLLLNPDTVVEEDTFLKVVEFMDKNADGGGLGVKMVDGKGQFLPESKRGLPTPLVAFWKLFGLSTIFPKSKTFGQYHLGHLDKDETHEVDVLCGAFMLMRRKTLDKVGLLDENFFMYGEDIDLSYRIQKGGYKNYYFSDTTIIHYKGESTKKSSVNYVLVFYRAMVIFAQKHFSQKNAKLFSFLINSAIYLRAGFAILSRFIKKATPPVIDTAIISAGMIFLTQYWAYRGVNFPEATYYISIPTYACIWGAQLYIQGTYDRPFKWAKPLKALLYGLAIILIAYALLPKDYQFSRLYIFASGAWLISYLGISRSLLHLFFNRWFSFSGQNNAVFGIVGDPQETSRVENILRQTVPEIKELHFISSNDEKTEDQIGSLNQLDQVAHIKKLDEIIFCAKNCSAGDIIHWMKKLEGKDIDFKIAQPDTLFLIGSNSIDTAGDLYLMHVNKIEDPTKRRTKRILDISLAFIALLLSPILSVYYTNKKQFVSNMLSVFTGKFSLVGYFESEQKINKTLPKLKVGILRPSDLSAESDKNHHEKLNLIYARDYSISKDIVILKNCWKMLDRPT